MPISRMTLFGESLTGSRCETSPASPMDAHR
jgi:hypothetical protein